MPCKFWAAEALLRPGLNSKAEIAAELVSSSAQERLPVSHTGQRLRHTGLRGSEATAQRAWRDQHRTAFFRGSGGHTEEGRKTNPRSPLAHLLCVSTRRCLSGGAGVQGSAGRHGIQMLPHPPPTSREIAGANICSHLYKTAVCLAAQSLLCDPGSSYVTTLPHLPPVAASLRG